MSKQGCKKLHPTDPLQNFGTFLGGHEEDPGLSVANYTNVHGYHGQDLGWGVKTEVARQKGDMLPLLVWGDFTTEEKFIEQAKAKGLPTEFPPIPGAFALHTPYEKTVCMIAENCPARFVNDARGVTSASANIQFLQHIDPRDLCHDYSKGLHLFLQGQAVRDIEAGQQLFLDYGNMFWEDHQPIARKVIEEDILNDVGDQPFSLDSEDDVLFGSSLFTPPSGDKPTNALTISQEASSPPSPVAFPDLGDANALANELELYKNNSSEKKSSEKNKPKKPSKSGGGKDINLDELPQTSTGLQSSKDMKKKNTKKDSKSSKKQRKSWEEAKSQSQSKKRHPSASPKRPEVDEPDEDMDERKALKAAEAQSYARE